MKRASALGALQRGQICRNASLPTGRWPLLTRWVAPLDGASRRPCHRRSVQV